MSETTGNETDGSGDEGSGTIPELEQRITSALNRIGVALDGAGSGDDTEIVALTAAVEEERKTNAELENSLHMLKERQKNSMHDLEERVKGLGVRAAEQERELARLREINDQLRENNRQLREANATGLGDADLINAAVQAELDALREGQSASASELDAILSELRNVVQAASTADATTDTPQENV